MPLKPGFIASLEQMRSGDGRRLPPHLKEEIVREHERLCLVAKQLAGIETKSRAELRAPARGSAAAKIAQLVDLKSIGVTTAWGRIMGRDEETVSVEQRT
jgi:transposase